IVLRRPASAEEVHVQRIAVISARNVYRFADSWQLVVCLLQVHVAIGDVDRLTTVSVAGNRTSVGVIIIDINGGGGAGVVRVTNRIGQGIQSGITRNGCIPRS